MKRKLYKITKTVEITVVAPSKEWAEAALDPTNQIQEGSLARDLIPYHTDIIDEETIEESEVKETKGKVPKFNMGDFEPAWGRTKEDLEIMDPDELWQKVADRTYDYLEED